jgi:hypothetical protein
MRLIKAAGIVWGVCYFVFGALSSFTLNSIDFGTSVAALFAIFLAPLPIAFVAIWFPKTAGAALLICVATTIAAVSSFVVSHRGSQFGEVRFIVILALYNLPHLFFALAYMATSRTNTTV